ncbi:large ribosomal subunit protein uL13m isoform X3 [Callithrix jacchus]|uniref:39S ribosomal protein L13, mitochondrial isoform X3 n=1 Tax=Callithrix jacchus TaxID=9483 RepID=UPI0023DD07C1|nr:39S ribosomal protein L13, mitochondrial isoform X3 [Callithrix jacchus]
MISADSFCGFHCPQHFMARSRCQFLVFILVNLSTAFAVLDYILFNFHCAILNTQSYPGGFRQVTAAQLHLKDPVAIVKLAIYGMLPKNLHRRTMMQRLHLFPDEDIPEDILKNLVEELPQPRKIPKRLDEYTQEEIDAFPRLWTPPEDFRL